jgi:hypothetical protein
MVLVFQLDQLIVFKFHQLATHQPMIGFAGTVSLGQL